MTDTADAGRVTPWHLWVVGVLSLLWNAYGGYDYWMSHTDPAGYLPDAAQVAFIDAMPSWMHAMWAVGVWGSVLGSILLLLRSKWAVWAFAASLLGVLTNLVYTYGLSNGAEATGQMGMMINGSVTLVVILLFLYAQAMSKRGVLR